MFACRWCLAVTVWDLSWEGGLVCHNKPVRGGVFDQQWRALQRQPTQPALQFCVSIKRPKYEICYMCTTEIVQREFTFSLCQCRMQHLETLPMWKVSRICMGWSCAYLNHIIYRCHNTFRTRRLDFYSELFPSAHILLLSHICALGHLHIFIA